MQIGTPGILAFLCGGLIFAGTATGAPSLLRGGSFERADLSFSARDNDRVRVQWFPGASGRLHTGVAGVSLLDDVSLALREPVPRAVRDAFALQRSRRSDEIVPAQMPRRRIGPRRPCRPIVCRDGVLTYEDGTEVALWGVNFQTALSTWARTSVPGNRIVGQAPVKSSMANL